MPQRVRGFWPPSSSLLKRQQPGQVPRASAERKKGHFKWVDHVQKLTEDEFKARYRLGSDSFYTLLDRLEPHLSPASKFHALQAARRNSGHPVEPAVKLAVCLRFLAGGQVLDLKLIYNLLAKSTVYAYVWEVVDAINMELVIEFPIEDRSKLDILEKEFRARSRNQVWAGQVGAIDGVHFKMVKPPPHVPDGARYFVKRKDEFALLCIAICDADRRYLYYDISQCSTTHDSLAWSASGLGVQFAEGKLPEGLFINGDNAFSGGRSVVVPCGVDDS